MAEFYPTDLALPTDALALPDGERWTWRTCANQIYRLKHNWGYGRRSPEQSRRLAEEAAWEAVRIVRAHPAQDRVAIPRSIHRVVPERVDDREELFWQGFAVLHPGWDLRTWRDPLDPADFPVTASRWKSARNGAQLADLIRTEVLVAHGGIYVDADVQPVRPLDQLLEAGAFAAWEDERTVPNAVMGCSPGHPAFAALLDLMLARTPGPTWWAGPGACTTIFPGREDVALFDEEAFYPVSYRDKMKDQKMREFNSEEHPDTLALHWYAGSWLKKA